MTMRTYTTQYFSRTLPLVSLSARLFSSTSAHDVSSQHPSGPLSGYRVLDLGQVVAGNFAGTLFAYFGADVIKVEPPGRGDALRQLRDLDSSGTSLWWRSYGRNRRCITVDLHNEEGRKVIKALATKADVLLENFRPGVMEAWGLGPADLGSHLVYARISGYGQTGPKAQLPGYASVCEAYGGFRYLNGYPDRPPVRPNISLGDSLAGLHAAFGAVMALLHREAGRSGSGKGSGQVIDAAISESLYNMLEGCIPEYFASGAVRPPSGSTLTGVVPSGCWMASDGIHIIIGGNGNSVYNRLMTAVGRPDMGTANLLYATDSLRCERQKEICDVLERWVASHDSNHVLKVLHEARVPAGPILSTADIAVDPQYRAREMFHQATPPSSSETVTIPAILPVLSGTPGSTRWAGPELGEHTEEVLKGSLGMCDEEIANLRELGAI